MRYNQTNRPATFRDHGAPPPQRDHAYYAEQAELSAFISRSSVPYDDETALYSDLDSETTEVLDDDHDPARPW